MIWHIPYIVVLVTTIVAGIVALRYWHKYRWANRLNTLVHNNVLTPDNTIILFDIHGVILQPDYPKMIRTTLQAQHKGALLWYLLHPRVLWQGVLILFHHPVVEHCIIKVVNCNPHLKKYLNLGIAISNAQKPVVGMLDIIRQLHNAGYTLHILSNIGERTFAGLQEQFANIFMYFSVIEVAKSANNYQGKPDPRVFAQYLAQHNQHNKHVLFIDDKLQNLIVAENMGMIPLYFRSARTLRATLDKLL